MNNRQLQDLKNYQLENLKNIMKEQEFNYKYFSCDTDDPILWRAFVDKIEKYLGNKMYDSQTVGMLGYIKIGESQFSSEITRSGSSGIRHCDIYQVNTFADLDWIPNEPRKVKVKAYKLPNLNGYSGKFHVDEYGNSCVKYGCAIIPIDVIQHAKTLCDIKKGNRSVDTIVLNSGVQLSKAEIEKILDEYVKYRNSMVNLNFKYNIHLSEV